MTRDLVLAWSTWERWCRANSKAKGKQRGNAGKPEACALKAAEIALAGDGHCGLHDAIARGRREGLSVEQAVALAVSDVARVMSDNGSSF